MPFFFRSPFSKKARLFRRVVVFFGGPDVDKVIIGVIGSSLATGKPYNEAMEVGRLAAGRGASVLTGGLGGVMEAACRGAKEAGGQTIGILPGFDTRDANPYVDIPIVTGLNHARNFIVVRSSDVLIAVGGEYGTLSEIAFALKLGKTVISIESWDVGGGMIKAASPADAVEKAFEAVK
ncbi:MAG: TIGR00725 family protein [Nitrospirae bacterium]|nr:TIGR00725 family protein [Nitrospirota bacterium]